MGFRGNNSRAFAEYVELEIAVDEYSPNAYLFKRRDSETNKPVSDRSWYVGIPIPNKGNGKRLSLGTSDLSLAKRKAQQKVVSISADLQLGVDVCGRSVQQMIDVFLEEKQCYVRGHLVGRKEGGRKSITIERYENIAGKLRNYFIPFVGSSFISTNLTPKSFDKWDKWRMENPKGSGKKKVAPKQSTIAEEMTLFREVWNWGISEGFIRASLKKPFDGYNLVEDEKVRRETWTLPEWNEFLKRESEWYKLEQNSEDQVRVWHSFIAHQLIRILASSGLRSKEWSLLKWKDVIEFDIENPVDENEKLGIEMSIHPSTKTGHRKAYCTGAIYFKNIYERTKFKRKNDYVFTDLNGKRLEPKWLSEIFNGEGKCNGLIGFTDQYKLTGKHLVPYCLRHFYATQSIYNGVSQQIIADNMGISMSRLKKSYKHCFLRVQTNHLFKKSDTQNPINNTRSFGTGEYAFFMGSRNKKVPTSRNKSKKIGLFLSDIEVGV